MVSIARRCNVTTPCSKSAAPRGRVHLISAHAEYIRAPIYSRRSSGLPPARTKETIWNLLSGRLSIRRARILALQISHVIEAMSFVWGEIIADRHARPAGIEPAMQAR